MSVPSIKFPDEWHIMFTRISGKTSLPLKIASTRSSHLVNKRTELLVSSCTPQFQSVQNTVQLVYHEPVTPEENMTNSRDFVGTCQTACFTFTTVAVHTDT